jgi:hypothetical protein
MRGLKCNCGATCPASRIVGARLLLMKSGLQCSVCLVACFALQTLVAIRLIAVFANPRTTCSTALGRVKRCYERRKRSISNSWKQLRRRKLGESATYRDRGIFWNGKAIRSGRARQSGTRG